MGRGVESDLAALSGEGGGHQVTHGAFPVGARYVDALVLPMRMSHQSVHHLHPFQSRMIGLFPDRLKGRMPGKKFLHKLFVPLHLPYFFVKFAKILNFGGFLRRDGTFRCIVCD